jgi:transposase
VDNRLDTITNIASFYYVNAETLRRNYKYQTSGFMQWDQRDHSEEYLLFEQNLAEVISIDETSLSKGELYTFVTNKLNHGRKTTLISSVNSTKSKDIIEVLSKISLEKRQAVKEVTLDMASNIELAVKKVFPNAMLTTDHFHVIRLAMEALQNVRVHYRWEELDQENAAISCAKNMGQKYSPSVLPNGDTPKQLLARSRYILAKRGDEWTASQKQRAKLVFKNYPLIAKAYNIVMKLRLIYKSKTRAEARIRLGKWITEVQDLGIKKFTTVAYTIQARQETILNYFVNRNTNANAESFNAKIKQFRANLKGVKDIPFFMFRLKNLFA